VEIKVFQKAIFFPKLLPLFFLFSLFLFGLEFVSSPGFIFRPHFFIESVLFLDFFGSFCLGRSFFVFSLMLCVVMLLILVYREVYVEGYNLIKYSSFLLCFFLSMAILTISSSFPRVIFSWEALGVSSLVLIIFYPNEVSYFNSFITIFFNRIGDFFLFLSLCLSIRMGSIHFIDSHFDSTIFYFFLFCCAFTKGAQFPFSSWLPAAMSAPTPVSALVHSSTLVTAGLFLVSKIMFHCGLNLPFLSLFLFLSFFGYAVGSLLSNNEADFKKIVAYSTLRQISMITFFMLSRFLYCRLFHMLGHALFKSLLFCCAGLLFIQNFSNQVSGKLSSNKVSFLALASHISCFSMSGLLFSFSFFSKDPVLEEFLDFSNFANFGFIFGFRVMTLFYCCSLRLSFSVFSWVTSFRLVKCLNVSVFFLYSLFILFMGLFIHTFLWGELLRFLSLSELFLILVLLVWVVVSKLTLRSKILMYLSTNTFLIKNFLFPSPQSKFSWLFTDHFGKLIFFDVSKFICVSFNYEQFCFFVFLATLVLLLIFLFSFRNAVLKMLIFLRNYNSGFRKRKFRVKAYTKEF